MPHINTNTRTNPNSPNCAVNNRKTGCGALMTCRPHNKHADSKKLPDHSLTCLSLYCFVCSAYWITDSAFYLNNISMYLTATHLQDDKLLFTPPLHFPANLQPPTDEGHGRDCAHRPIVYVSTPGQANKHANDMPMRRLSSYRWTRANWQQNDARTARNTAEKQSSEHPRT